MFSTIWKYVAPTALKRGIIFQYVALYYFVHSGLFQYPTERLAIIFSLADLEVVTYVKLKTERTLVLEVHVSRHSVRQSQTYADVILVLYAHLW